MTSYYPISVDIGNKPVLVVGGGPVACRKVTTLLEYGAQIKVVSPEICEELQALVDQGYCSWAAKSYTIEDIQEEVLVFSCTDMEQVNEQVARDARANFRPVNVVDDPGKCSFFVPAVLRRGDLTIAVSTGGSSPLVARQIRIDLEKIYGPEMKEYLELLRFWRPKIKSALVPAKRIAFWAKVTNGEVLTLIKNGRLPRAKEVIETCFQSLLD